MVSHDIMCLVNVTMCVCCMFVVILNVAQLLNISLYFETFINIYEHVVMLINSS